MFYIYVSFCEKRIYNERREDINTQVIILQRNGADYSVFINTASEFDGSDSGAAPDEAVSWGKIKMTANPVKVSCL